MAKRRTTRKKNVTPEDIAMKKLELVERLVDFPEELNFLKDQANSLLEETDLGTKQAKLNHELNLAKLEETYEEKQAELQKSFDDKADTLKAQQVALKESTEEKEQEYKRQLEQLKYDHKIAIERLNKDTLFKLGAELNYATVPTEDYASMSDKIEKLLTDYQQLDEELKETKKLRNAFKAKYNAVSTDFDKFKAVSEVRGKSAEEEITRLRKRVENLELQLENVPSAIKEAVGASRADITVNQTK